MIGAESIRAAEAAACAAEQGQFWPYHDTIFANQLGENQGAFSVDALQAFADALGLEQPAFNECLASGRFRSEVQAETAAARARGVNSTPTLFINGQLVEGALPFDRLQPMIEAVLAEAASESSSSE